VGSVGIVASVSNPGAGPSPRTNASKRHAHMTPPRTRADCVNGPHACPWVC
jgi:hypothetical protein